MSYKRIITDGGMGAAGNNHPNCLNETSDNAGVSKKFAIAQREKLFERFSVYF